MKFIHTSDLHLDAVMESKLSPEKAGIRRNELLAAFSSLAQTAEREGVSAVIIAGDLFDRNSVTVRARRFFVEAVKSHPSVDFLLLFGNHDANALLSLENIPDNLKIFGSDLASVSYGSTVITAAYPGSPPPALNPDKLNIVVMHGAVGSEIDLGPYRNIGVAYLALGHYHTYSCEPLDRDGVYCYSGCLEGRGFDECGEKGYVLLDAENGKLTHRFVPSSIRQVLEVRADLSDGVDYGKQRELIYKALEGLDRKNLVRLIITGKYEPGRTKFYGNITEELASGFFCLEMKDESTIKISQSDYEGEISLKAEFIRLAKAEIADEQVRSRVISLGLAALHGEELQ